MTFYDFLHRNQEFVIIFSALCFGMTYAILRVILGAMNIHKHGYPPQYVDAVGAHRHEVINEVTFDTICDKVDERNQISVDGASSVSFKRTESGRRKRFPL